HPLPMPPLAFSRRSRAHPDLHSFPTRRSSDLADVQFEFVRLRVLIRHRLIVAYLLLQGFDLGDGALHRDLERANRTFESLQKIRSEEHTSELQSPDHLVCRLLLDKKNKKVKRD